METLTTLFQLLLLITIIETFSETHVLIFKK